MSLRRSDEQGAGQLTIRAGKRGIVRVVLPAKRGGLPTVGVFLLQGLIRWIVAVEFGVDGGLPLLCHQRGLGSNKILAVITEDAGLELGLRLCREGWTAYCMDQD